MALSFSWHMAESHALSHEVFAFIYDDILDLMWESVRFCHVALSFTRNFFTRILYSIATSK